VDEIVDHDGAIEIGGTVGVKVGTILDQAFDLVIDRMLRHAISLHCNDVPRAMAQGHVLR